MDQVVMLSDKGKKTLAKGSLSKYDQELARRMKEIQAFKGEN